MLPWPFDTFAGDGTPVLLLASQRAKLAPVLFCVLNTEEWVPEHKDRCRDGAFAREIRRVTRLFLVEHSARAMAQAEAENVH